MIAGSRKTQLALLLVLACAAAALFPCLGNGFVDWDDDVLVTANPYVQTLSLDNLRAILFEPLTNAYHPLPFLVWSLEYRLWGAEPFGYHLVNLLLHLGTAALVFRWVLRLEASLPAATVAALLFAVHPMRVESVAWVSDLKDLLAGFFFMASLLAFERWLSAGQRRWYLSALGLFFLAAVSKSTAVALPAVLVLGDFLRRRRLDRQAVVEKAPFFALAALFALVAVVSRARFETFVGAAVQQEPYELSYRLYLIGHRLVFYFLQRTVLPWRGIESLYPDVVGGPYWPGVAAWGAVLALLLVVLALSARFTRKGLFGAGFFLVTLAPALATVSYGFSADRFSYVPAVGLSYLGGVAVAAAVAGTAGRRLARALIVAPCGIAIALLGIASWRQCGAWKDGVSLWSDAVDKFRGRPTSVNLGAALANRGRSWLMRGDYPRALADLDEALPIAPDRHHNLFLRAGAYAALGQRERAVADLTEALSLAPDYEAARQFLEQLTEPATLPGAGR